ncbi:nucleotide cyclase, partial [Dunaliella salina]
MPAVTRTPQTVGSLENINLAGSKAGGGHAGRTSKDQLLQGSFWDTARECAFVVTDIEGSTQLSSKAGPKLFGAIQEIHDITMREAIGQHSGLEITTEGDSFTLAFPYAPQAVAFCIDIQHRLLETAWPHSCAKLPGFRKHVNSKGETIIVGLRVRMGVHWAGDGTVASRLHAVNKQRIFAGPGMQMAQEVCVCVCVCVC